MRNMKLEGRWRSKGCGKEYWMQEGVLWIQYQDGTQGECAWTEDYIAKAVADNPSSWVRVDAPAREWQVGDVVECVPFKGRVELKNGQCINWFSSLEMLTKTPQVIKEVGGGGDHVYLDIFWYPVSELKLITPAPVCVGVKIEPVTKSASVPVEAFDCVAVVEFEAPRTPAEVLTEQDWGTTKTDRRMRAEREQRRQAAQAQAMEYRTRLAELAVSEGVRWLDPKDKSDHLGRADYTRLTGHVWEE